MSTPSSNSSVSSVVAINGAQLIYDVSGDGPALVLIHAGIADRRMWDDQIPAFSRNYRVLRYDLRGYGQSDLPPEPYAHHEDLAGLMRHLGIAHAHILGASIGGQIAIDFTLAYPAMVRSLIRVASGVGEQEPSDVLKRAWKEMEIAAEADDFAQVIELELKLWVDGSNRGPESVNSAVRDRVREMNTALVDRIAEQDAAEEVQLKPPAIDRLAEIGVPTLIVVGDQDVPDVLAMADLMKTMIPNARKVVIPNAAHMVNMERLDDFNRVVLEFLGTH
ncbi:MAG: alpha/beta fold hydrolase [Thermomicrobiales bacterium]